MFQISHPKCPVPPTCGSRSEKRYPHSTATLIRKKRIKANSPANLDFTRTVRARITARKPIRISHHPGKEKDKCRFHQNHPVKIRLRNRPASDFQIHVQVLQFFPISRWQAIRFRLPAAKNSANTNSICRIAEINFAPRISQIDFGTMKSI